MISKLAIKQMNLSPLGKTALYICAGRALETKGRPPCETLFIDVYAEKLAGEYGFKFLEAMADTLPEVIPLDTRIKLLADAVSIRTAYIDNVIKKALFDEEIEQLVIMAVGGDCRPYRLELPKNCIIYEVDLPEVIEFRNKILNSLEAKCSNKLISFGCDLSQPEIWVKKIIENGFDSKKKSIFIVEGLIMYLEKQKVECLFKTIAEISCKGSYIVGDALSDEFLSSEHTKKMLEIWEKWGSPVVSTYSNLEELFEKINYKCTKNNFGDENCNFGRAPYHKKEDEKEGNPRNFLYYSIKQ